MISQVESFQWNIVKKTKTIVGKHLLKIIIINYLKPYNFVQFIRIR